MSKKEQLKQYIEGRYDYIGSIGIAKINVVYGFGCTLSECVDIHHELYDG